jgi:NAD(P)-dependent dehydrogenase (short-subunit alcohol dehydrogenase family)
VRATVTQLLQWSPQVDVLVNNAGVWTDNDLELTDPARRQLAVDTNLLGHLQVTGELLPVLRQQGSGHILNVISTSGDALTPSGDNTAWLTYGATKWGMTGFTKGLRESLIGSGIKVSGFFPGGIDTNLYENAQRPGENHHQPWIDERHRRSRGGPVRPHPPRRRPSGEPHPHQVHGVGQGSSLHRVEIGRAHIRSPNGRAWVPV